MMDRAVELHVAGQKCRVVTTADESELQQLAEMVEERLASVLPEGRPVTTQAMLLVAIALAAELRESSERSDKIESHARESLGGLLERVDTAIADSDAIEKEREGRRKRNSNKGLSNKALSSLAPSGEPAPSDDA
jgi:cell division protein ZapA